jgi:hypothetical protein
VSGVHELVASSHQHDARTGSGQLLLDDGRLLPYDGAAFAAGGLRLLRPGQRVRVRLDRDLEDPGVTVVALTLATLEL